MANKNPSRQGGAEQWQDGDVDVLHAQPRDRLLEHLRRGVEDAMQREPLLEMLKPYHTASRAAVVDHRTTSSHFDPLQ